MKSNNNFSRREAGKKEVKVMARFNAGQIDHMKSKYELYIQNIEWDIKTNERTPEVVQRLKERINDFKEVLEDLKKIYR